MCRPKELQVFCVLPFHAFDLVYVSSCYWSHFSLRLSIESKDMGSVCPCGYLVCQSKQYDRFASKKYVNSVFANETYSLFLSDLHDSHYGDHIVYFCLLSFLFDCARTDHKLKSQKE